MELQIQEIIESLMAPASVAWSIKEWTAKITESLSAADSEGSDELDAPSLKAVIRSEVMRQASVFLASSAYTQEETEEEVAPELELAAHHNEDEGKVDNEDEDEEREGEGEVDEEDGDSSDNESVGAIDVLNIISSKSRSTRLQPLGRKLSSEKKHEKVHLFPIALVGMILCLCMYLPFRSQRRRKTRQ